jgi:hypothetical protein
MWLANQVRRYVETPLIKSSMSLDPGSPLALDIERTPLQRMCTMEEVRVFLPVYIQST